MQSWRTDTKEYRRILHLPPLQSITCTYDDTNERNLPWQISFLHACNNFILFHSNSPSWSLYIHNLTNDTNTCFKKTISLQDGVLHMTKNHTSLLIVDFHVCQVYKYSSLQALLHVVFIWLRASFSASNSVFYLQQMNNSWWVSLPILKRTLTTK